MTEGIDIGRITDGDVIGIVVEQRIDDTLFLCLQLSHRANNQQIILDKEELLYLVNILDNVLSST